MSPGQVQPLLWLPETRITSTSLLNRRSGDSLGGCELYFLFERDLTDLYSKQNGSGYRHFEIAHHRHGPVGFNAPVSAALEIEHGYTKF